jgi:hypothetical protein
MCSSLAKVAVVLGGGNWELGLTCPWPLCVEFTPHMHCPQYFRQQALPAYVSDTED